VVRVDPDGRRETFRSLVNPEMPIPEQATAVHHITDEDVADAPRLAGLAPRILELFAGADLAGYNSVRFDLPLLVTDLRRVGFEFEVAGRRHFDACRIFHTMEPRDLSAACRVYCGRELEGAHSALADVEATLDVLDAQVGHYADLPRDPDELHRFCNPDEGRFIDVGRKFAWDDQGRPVFNFGKHRGRPLESVAVETPDYLRWMLGKDFGADVVTILREALAGRYPVKG